MVDANYYDKGEGTYHLFSPPLNFIPRLSEIDRSYRCVSKLNYLDNV
ncbi:4586_t:CDS:2 [Entrophospora sp. SA101]|nr:4586_t:CDS:2 [Entrophospora sp. SA101]